MVSACGNDDNDNTGTAVNDRRAEVAARGAEVMPFDLDATTHIFSNTDTGGVQVVHALDPADETQIALIRQHLAEEAERFGRGDFGDPAQIHGHDMPGLAELQEGAAAIEVIYADIVAGASLTYRTSDPDLVAAIHRWFAAQVDDHGDHASHDSHHDS